MHYLKLKYMNYYNLSLSLVFSVDCLLCECWGDIECDSESYNVFFFNKFLTHFVGMKYPTLLIMKHEILDAVGQFLET